MATNQQHIATKNRQQTATLRQWLHKPSKPKPNQVSNELILPPGNRL